MNRKMSSSPPSIKTGDKGSISVVPGFKKANIPPPRPMVTAEERLKAKETRRSSPPTNRPKPNLQKATFRAPQNTSQEQAEAFQQDVDEFNNLQDDLLLAHVTEDMADIDAAIAAFTANLENIRARGYTYKSYLEKKIEALHTQWHELRPRVEGSLRTQQQALQTQAQAVQGTLSRGQRPGAALSALASKVSAAKTALESMYNPLDGNINQTQQQIDDISWTLQQAEQASFGFMPTETPVEAVPANWKKPDDQDGVEGVLFLTDQRLLFEQKEEVATKKIFFITTETQKLQALNWQIPVVEIEKALGSNRGFMGKDDFLTVTCTQQGAFQDAEGKTLYMPGVGGKLTSFDLHLKGEKGEAWAAHINRVRTREIDKERTVQLSQEVVEAVQNAPTKCTTCGATITQTIMRGQTEITCEYCGSKMRL